ncbi:hybrid-cluster NAD(P)-dependent oxidoreductase [Novosphingobium flavum]|uniref:Hybrid-cluster NAD(P)-dependent oxidoreductase n=2 Tax=Novosphingobium aerophilum TaxID=2839843 RepID=A0A7X1KD48_9SPHN|nr:hybrid-cluster NAD(P)-dependent oxidoreductase [Novosphingobium aerophilum]MBC2652777.1 hybrid-cluster NAD(P)-dependent oxidoreductase [Novosphingobium aerophilum]MBC2660832.1 hybrid-cluster NAD(P)-dependent oxidoreductase [Novosphingobium aerophilum]
MPHALLSDMAWDARRQMLQLIAVVEEAANVKTFTFRAAPGTWFRYKPGQFITLELPVENGPVLRTYTLSSSPSRPFAISVTVKAQPGSVGTRWMFDHLRLGDQLRAHGPSGHFTHFGHGAAKYLFLSAGSGVTPMMSMLRWFADCAPDTDVAFVSCARLPEDILFRRELELAYQQMPALTLDFLVEARSAQAAWAGHKGRIDADRLHVLVPDLSEREVFCCGPEPFMRLVRDLLQGAGFDMGHYHQESFGVEVASAPPEHQQDDAAAPQTEPLAISFTLSRVEGHSQLGHTVLQTARALGVRIPAACEAGICGTCKVRLLSGSVAMTHSGGIFEEDVEDGYILACCSRPTNPISIEA